MSACQHQVAPFGRSQRLRCARTEASATGNGACRAAPTRRVRPFPGAGLMRAALLPTTPRPAWPAGACRAPGVRWPRRRTGSITVYRGGSRVDFQPSPPGTRGTKCRRRGCTVRGESETDFASDTGGTDPGQGRPRVPRRAECPTWCREQDNEAPGEDGPPDASIPRACRPATGLGLRLVEVSLLQGGHCPPHKCLGRNGLGRRAVPALLRLMSRDTDETPTAPAT